MENLGFAKTGSGEKRSLGALAAAVLNVFPVALCAAEPGAGPAGDPLRVPPAAQILSNLRTEHPRLLAHEDDFARLRVRVKDDPTLADWHARLRERATRLLAEPPSTYEIPDGLRLLSVSRRVVDRVYTLALEHRLDGDPRWVERAWRELEAAAAFPDWNPRHFLDTAEMTHAFAIGYDWLFSRWSSDQRERLRRAILDKGLGIAVDAYRGRNNRGGWIKARHNWNQVCNGGIGMGALALADVDPGPAGEFLAGALASLQLPMREFAPDGAWAEGPGYWNYATAYNVVFIAALETALGSDFGLVGIPGFAEAGAFPIHLTGPLRKTFNYADGSDGTIRAPQLFWLASRFDRPAYARYQRAVASPQPLDLLWFNPALAAKPAPELPTARYFRHAEVVTLRSAWDDPQAVFVGFKAGDNKANHSNLDLGSFVLDALGVRWGLDLGADDYNLPGYFGRQRWEYYRLRAEGHNTLVLNPANGPDQDPAAAATIASFDPPPADGSSANARARADLSAAYRARPGTVTRQIELRAPAPTAPGAAPAAVVLRDTVRAEAPAEVWWFFHTRAAVALTESDRTAQLTQDGKRLDVRLGRDVPGRFEVRDARPLPSSPNPERQNPNTGIRKLALHYPAIRNLDLEVTFAPVPGGSSPSNP